MEAFKNFTGLVAPLDRPNVDTDQIIPKQFLKAVVRSGLGAGLFYDWRKQPGSQFVLVPGSGHNPLTEKPEFVIPCIRNFLARRDVAASREGQETQRVVEEAV